ncbi:sporulation protein YpjB [Pullulanibacillus pueri]|uniref:Sporulation protein YpjB n=1 Tax=Pullulanibacillus pueri TaxID=1437324 RepID=A0A8J3ELK6_9BACL|nr:sporulation protein YpjB [Pullulanibacillus pueri]MBM7681446.1 sporulation protein YpjB [Pullulanibacillus pueri]GGH78910.1 sporulation protein YpjB [Pullulanibacillus pueri]
MKKIWVILIICILLLTLGLGNTVHGKEQVPQSLDSLVPLSNKIYEFINDQEYNAAKESLKQFEKKLNTLTNNEQASLDPTVIRTVTTSEEQLKIMLGVDEKNNQELHQAALELRLVIDALGSDGEPLWKSLKKPLFSAFNKVKQDAANKNDQSYQYDLNQFVDLYQTIYPALVVDISPMKLGQIDQAVTKLVEARTTTTQDVKKNKKQLQEVSKDLNRLFDSKLTTIVLTGPMLWAIVLGSVVVITLFYVIWRKYRGKQLGRAYP